MSSLPELKTVVILGEGKVRGTLNFDDLLDAASPAQVKAITDLQDTLQFDDPINIQFTSVSCHPVIHGPVDMKFVSVLSLHL